MTFCFDRQRFARPARVALVVFYCLAYGAASSASAVVLSEVQAVQQIQRGANTSSSLGVPRAVAADVDDAETLPQSAAGHPAAVMHASPRSARSAPLFVLHKVRVRGAHVATSADLSPICKPYYNKAVTAVDLQQMLAAITRWYVQHGYVLSQAVLPPQQIKDGHVLIYIVEGYLAGLHPYGKIDSKTARFLRELGASFPAERPLSKRALARTVYVLRHYPGLETQFFLRPGPVFGSSDLVVLAAQSPPKSLFVLDNKGPDSLGIVRAQLQAESYALWRAADVWRAQFLASGGGKLRYAKLSTEQPIGYNGDVLSVAVSHTRMRPAGPVALLALEGNTLDYQLRYTHLQSHDESRTFKWGLGSRYLNSRLEAWQIPLSQDRLRVLDLFAEYQWFEKPNQRSALHMHWLKGLDLFGHTPSAETSRVAAVPDFTAWTLEWMRQQRLSEQVFLNVSVQGQYSFHPLSNLAQFTYGGEEYGRAFYGGDLSGDSGVAAKLELSYQPRHIRSVLPREYFVYVDRGFIANKSNEVGLPTAASAGAVGLGLRWAWRESCAVEVGYHLPWRVTHTAIGTRKPRLLFSLSFFPH